MWQPVILEDFARRPDFFFTETVIEQAVWLEDWDAVLEACSQSIALKALANEQLKFGKEALDAASVFGHASAFVEFTVEPLRRMKCITPRTFDCLTALRFGRRAEAAAAAGLERFGPEDDSCLCIQSALVVP